MVIETKRLIITTGMNTGTVLLFRNKHRDEINMGTDTKGPSLLVQSLLVHRPFWCKEARL